MAPASRTHWRVLIGALSLIDPARTFAAESDTDLAPETAPNPTALLDPPATTASLGQSAGEPGEDVSPLPQDGTTPEVRWSQSEPGAVPLRRQWFGWQTLVVDTFAGALVISSATDSPVGMATMLGVSTYLFGAPVVHWAHGQLWVGTADLVLRLVAPIAGGYAGARLADCPSDSGGLCRLAPMIAGGLVGMAVAMAFDAVVLSWETVPASPGPSAGPRSTWLSTVGVNPMLTVGPDHRHFGVEAQGHF